MKMDGLNSRTLGTNPGVMRTPAPTQRTGSPNPIEQREIVELACTPAPALDKTGQKQFANEVRTPDRGGSFQFPDQMETPQRDGDLHWVLGGARPEDKSPRVAKTLPFEGEPGSLLGNRPTSKPNFEDFNGAFLRH